MILALALLTCGCLASRTGAVVFPTQSEVSVVTMNDGQHAETGLRYQTALSWASVSPACKLECMRLATFRFRSSQGAAPC